MKNVTEGPLIKYWRQLQESKIWLFSISWLILSLLSRFDGNHSNMVLISLKINSSVLIGSMSMEIGCSKLDFFNRLFNLPSMMFLVLFSSSFVKSILAFSIRFSMILWSKKQVFFSLLKRWMSKVFPIFSLDRSITLRMPS